LAVPLTRHVQVEAEPTARGTIEVRTHLYDREWSGRWSVLGHGDAEAGPLRFVGLALEALAERGLTPPSAHLRITSDLPAGRGFSSSAASMLAVLDALIRLRGRQWPPLELAELAYVVEHERLGVACGRLDPLACASGSPIHLRWEAQGHTLTHVPPPLPLHLLVGTFSTPRDTGAILTTLNDHFFGRAEPLESSLVLSVRRALSVFAEEADRGTRALRAGDMETLGDAMNRAQAAYEEYLAERLPALQAPGLRHACRVLREAGALGAKFSGAGGDGSVVALFRDRRTAEDARSRVNAAGLALTTFHCPVV
jgi:mevalonate kinase